MPTRIKYVNYANKISNYLCQRMYFFSLFKFLCKKEITGDNSLHGINPIYIVDEFTWCSQQPSLHYISLSFSL